MKLNEQKSLIGSKILLHHSIIYFFVSGTKGKLDKYGDIKTKAESIMYQFKKHVEQQLSFLH